MWVCSLFICTRAHIHNACCQVRIKAQLDNDDFDPSLPSLLQDCEKAVLSPIVNGVIKRITQDLSIRFLKYLFFSYKCFSLRGIGAGMAFGHSACVACVSANVKRRNCSDSGESMWWEGGYLTQWGIHVRQRIWASHVVDLFRHSRK